ncbi:amidase [Pelagibacteraceae bacterium]|uniref:amidase n=1 Tax=Pelagibacter sp. (strain IMCC9063) TaxID=1002672 RepID=UPI00020467ED|nr:amidase [Candidatus Pelagibacter sp. IMCC9063]AEA80932.1 amidase [Candidatus Pelagibacter sp. IMCC9063]MDB4022719.1 amidase [Pelagibacteraceae bacterium]
MPDILSLSANELAAQLREGEISSVEVCSQYIERIGKFEKDVKAWSHFNKKLLLEKAAEADEHRISGKPLGLLHGLPIAVKDIIGTLDMPTECGTTIRKKMTASQDSEVVNLLKVAGAIIMGKTETTELAYFHPGKTTNPHDYKRTPGGSSSGSAAAVAAYMTPLSIGSQTNGSTIRPASYCGVVGYKPSYGLISRYGILKQSDKLDQVGIFGKSVEDVALLAKVLIKKDLFDPSTIHYSAEEMMDVCRKGPLFDPKFIFYKTKNWKNLDKESQESFEIFIKTFKKNIEVFDTPSYFDDIPKYHKIIHETDMANNFQLYYKKYKKKLSKEMVSAIERGLKNSATEYAEAIDFMKRSYDSYKEVFEDYHGVLTPASSGVAPKGLGNTGSPEFSTVWTYLGLPSISLPLLTGKNDLPLGIQLIGDKYDDLRFLGVASWVEKNCKQND